LKRDKVVKIARLSSCKNFVSEIQKFIFNAFAERFENCLNNGTSKRVLNLLEPVKLTVWKVMIERVTVVKFRVNYGGGNGAGCFEVKVWADAAKFTDVIVARLRKCSDLIREGRVFVKNKTKVASAMGCSERVVLYFRQLLITPIICC